MVHVLKAVETRKKRCVREGWEADCALSKFINFFIAEDAFVTGDLNEYYGDGD